MTVVATRDRDLGHAVRLSFGARAASGEPAAPAPVARLPGRARVSRTIPQAFTQGLVYLDGVLYEGTGLERPIDHPQGPPRKRRSAADPEDRSQYFGEGIAVWGNSIAQLTWQSAASASSTTARTFSRTGRSPTTGEGWGLDARRHAPHHERRHVRPALPRSRDAEGDRARSRCATAACRSTT